MKKTLLLLLFSLSLYVFGQEEYYEHIIGEDNDYAYLNNITAIPDGGFALLGFQNNGANLSDIYLVKTDADGNEEWSQSYGSLNVTDLGLAAFITEDNQLLVVGHSEEVGQAETGEVFFKKIDLANGDEIWSKTTTMPAPYYEINLNNEGDEIWITERLLTSTETVTNLISYILHQFDFEGEKISELEISTALAPIIEDFEDFGGSGNLLTFGLISSDGAPSQIGIAEFNINDGTSINIEALEMPWTENPENADIIDFTFDSEGNLIVLILQEDEGICYMASYGEAPGLWTNYSYDWHIASPESLDYRITPSKNHLEYDANSEKIVAILQYLVPNDSEYQTACLQAQSDGTLLSYETFDINNFSDLHIDNDNLFIVGNNTQNSTTTKGILLQIEEDGTELFHKEYGIDGPSNSNSGIGIQYIGNDEFLVLNYQAFIEETQLLKMSKDGDILETYPFESSNSHRGIVISNDDQYLTSNYNFTEESTQLVKFTEEGEILWETPIPYNNLEPYQYLTPESDGYTYTILSEDENMAKIVSFVKIGEDGIMIDSVGMFADININNITSTYKMNNGHYIVSGTNGHSEFDEDKNLIQNIDYEDDTYFSRQIIEGPNNQVNTIGTKYVAINIDGDFSFYNSFYVLQFDENGNLIEEVSDTLQGRSIITQAIPSNDGTGLMTFGSTYNSDFSDRKGFLTKISWEGETEWTMLFENEFSPNNLFFDMTPVDEEIALIGRITKNNTAKLYYVNTDESIEYIADTTDTEVDTTEMVGINDLPFQNANIQLFPNPTQDKINMVFENEQVVNGNITITNAMGQSVKAIKAPIFPNATLEIPVSDLTDGVYILNIQNGTEMIAKRFVVQR